MSNKESNNEFFSYQGCISIKDYIINMLILTALFVCLSLVKFENFAQYISFGFLYDVLIFTVNLFKFVILMSALSVIYRRIEDFSQGRSYKFTANIKRLFALLFVFPVIYVFCFRYFINFIPFLINFMDFLVIMIAPVGFITLFILCFIKGR